MPLQATEEMLEDARSMLWQGRYPEAELPARQTLFANPANAEAMHVLACARSAHGDDFEAYRLYRQAERLEDAFSKNADSEHESARTGSRLDAVRSAAHRRTKSPDILTELFEGEPPAPEPGLRVANARIVWMDDAALLRDFPDLAALVGSTRSRLEEWVLAIGPVMSQAQLQNVAAKRRQRDPATVGERLRLG